MERRAMALRRGVKVIVNQPAADTRELRAICDEWGRRVEHMDLACGNSEMRSDLDRGQVTLVSWRDLREVQRAG